ncbi:type II toxin-antitoxin system PemK/MazF family toxin [Methylobacter sp.]|uniref:type II toxin-antitoxin system PemK/MazF family toxin n=1 Tax=Methylobacter sp. TaxID=2051955 RepID=UPI002FDE7B14
MFSCDSAFPVHGSGYDKKTACYYASNTLFNASVGHSVLAMVTSAKNSNWLHDVNISDLKSTGLSSASIVRMKLFTLDNRLIIRKAGILADSDQ